MQYLLNNSNQQSNLNNPMALIMDCFLNFGTVETQA